MFARWIASFINHYTCVCSKNASNLEYMQCLVYVFHGDAVRNPYPYVLVVVLSLWFQPDGKDGGAN